MEGEISNEKTCEENPNGNINQCNGNYSNNWWTVDLRSITST